MLTSLLECHLLLSVNWRVGGSIQTLIISTLVLVSGRYQRDGFDPLFSVPPKVQYKQTCLLFIKEQASSCKRLLSCLALHTLLLLCSALLLCHHVTQGAERSRQTPVLLRTEASWSGFSPVDEKTALSYMKVNKLLL